MMMKNWKIRLCFTEYEVMKSLVSRHLKESTIKEAISSLLFSDHDN